MNLIINEVNSQATKLILGMDRNCALGAAVGIAASRVVPLPTSDVSDSVSHYNLVVLPAVNQILSAFNEDCIMDVKFARQVAEQFWNVRFLAANPMSKRNLVPTYGFVDTIVGAGNFIDPQTHEFLNKYKNEILTLIELATGEASRIVNGDK